MVPRLLTPIEVSELLGVAPATLAVWRSTRRVVLPYVKIGRHVRYEPAAVEAFIASGTRDGVAAARR